MMKMGRVRIWLPLQATVCCRNPILVDDGSWYLYLDIALYTVLIW